MRATSTTFAKSAATSAGIISKNESLARRYKAAFDVYSKVIKNGSEKRDSEVLAYAYHNRSACISVRLIFCCTRVAPADVQNMASGSTADEIADLSAALRLKKDYARAYLKRFMLTKDSDPASAAAGM